MLELTCGSLHSDVEKSRPAGSICCRRRVGSLLTQDSLAPAPLGAQLADLGSSPSLWGQGHSGSGENQELPADSHLHTHRALYF